MTHEYWYDIKQNKKKTENTTTTIITTTGDLGSIPGRVIPKTLKIVLDTSLLSTQEYKVRINGKVEQSRERSNTLPPTPRCSS